MDYAPSPKLDAELILKNLPTHHDITLNLFESIHSTNTLLQHNLPANEDEIHVCIANEQTQGKGQHNKHWISPKDCNVYLSITRCLTIPREEWHHLSTDIAKTVKTVLESLIPNHELTIKLPNDILYQQKKLAGILIETFPYESLYWAVIGIGINVNIIADQQHSIDQPWTSLHSISGKTFDRNQICHDLIQRLI